MSDKWAERVDHYIQHVEQIAIAIEHLIGQCKVDTSQVATDKVNAQIDELSKLLRHLEDSIAEREQLLQDPAAPADGSTLAEKLKSLPGQETLQRRCAEVSARIADTNQNAVSLFVCQYHLADFSGELIRLITGEVAPPTYNAAMRTNESTPTNSGGLLNEEG